MILLDISMDEVIAYDEILLNMILLSMILLDMNLSDVMVWLNWLGLKCFYFTRDSAWRQFVLHLTLLYIRTDFGWCDSIRREFDWRSST